MTSSDKWWAGVTPEFINSLSDEKAELCCRIIALLEQEEDKNRPIPPQIQRLDVEEDEAQIKFEKAKQAIKKIESRAIAARQSTTYQKHLTTLIQRCHVGKSWGETLRRALEELDLRGYVNLAGKPETLIEVLKERVKKMLNGDAVIKLVAIQDFLSKQHSINVEMVA